LIETVTRYGPATAAMKSILESSLACDVYEIDVPERVTLQSRMQDYQSLIGTMRDYMNEDWSQGPQAVSPYAATQMGMSAPPGPPAWSQMPSHMPMRTSGGFPKWIIAPLVLVLVGVAFFATKGRAMLAARAATPAASSSAIAITTTAAKVPAPPTAPEKTAPAATASTAPAAPAAAPTTKPKTTKKKKST
jgi:hypothetical protein